MVAFRDAGPLTPSPPHARRTRGEGRKGRSRESELVEAPLAGPSFGFPQSTLRFPRKRGEERRAHPIMAAFLRLAALAPEAGRGREQGDGRQSLCE
jgi:hypothetical protein